MRTYTCLIAAILAVLLIAPASFAADKKASAKKDKTIKSVSPPPVKPATIQPTTGEEAKPIEVNQQTLQSPKSPSAGEQINWEVLSGGGGQMSTTGYQIRGTLGQTAAGFASTTGHNIHHGYWQNFASSTDCCDFPGDANNDGICDIGDCVWTLNWIFKYGPDPPCFNEAEVNEDCSIDIGDVVWTLNYIFKYGPPPTCGCYPTP
jgi:hypothetical protein